ncbi:MAG: hypothetical protein IB617_01020 [Candidatus Nealsonbacteria bacterium]|nr:MAG: hypothetical protein IB617_01020 [Candidatus Nealsonbacteria bacterium]
MDKYYFNLIINEMKKFKKLQKQWDYENLDDLIAHYIEENVISSKEELGKVLKILETKLGIKTKVQTFNSWW